MRQYLIKFLALGILVYGGTVFNAHAQEENFNTLLSDPNAKEAIQQYAQVYGLDTSSNPSGNNGGFNIANLIGSIIFSGVGFVAFVYGKKNAEWKPMAIGAVLTVYPYFVPNTLLMYVIGVVLTAFLFIRWD